MQPLQYDLRSRAAKDNSMTNAATARSNLDAAITMRSAETELQNTIELRATASEIVQEIAKLMPKSRLCAENLLSPAFPHLNAISRKSCLCHARNPNHHLNAADTFASF